MNGNKRRTQDDHEGRIVRLETGLQQVTETVGNLATAVHEQSTEIREQGRNFEKELKGLAIAIRDAGAPKQTDWHLIVKTLGVMLAVGALVFVPLNMRIDWQDQQARAHHQEDSEAMTKVKDQLQRETQLINDKYDREIQNLGDRIIGRLNGYDEDRLARDRADLEELRQWRMKSMGLCPLLESK